MATMMAHLVTRLRNPSFPLGRTALGQFRSSASRGLRAQWLGRRILFDVLGLLALPPVFLWAWNVLPHAILIPAVVVVTAAYYRIVAAVASSRQSRPMASSLQMSGVFDEADLLGGIEAELARSRRFGHEFALVLMSTDDLHRRFDYRTRDDWEAALGATADLLKKTRMHVDRIYRFGPHGFALILPESGPDAVAGMVRRMSRLAKRLKPKEGDPNGPLPLFYGATFYPSRALTTQDLLRRADLALRLAKDNAVRLHLDGAKAPEAAPPTSLRSSRKASRPKSHERPAREPGRRRAANL